MKEFLKNDTVTYNLMSFTGYKTLILFSLLTESPKSYHDVRKYFLEHPYLREQISLDTLRVYMNSFKRAGCKVVRVRENGISKYFIPENPFKLNISPIQQKAVIKVYKTLTNLLGAEEIIALDAMLLKLTNYIENEDFIASYKKISVLHKLNPGIIRKLLECCRNKKQLTLVYNSPHTGVKEIEIIALRLVYKNNKMYVKAKGFEYNQDTEFLVSRIIDIRNIKDCRENINEEKEVTVTYELRLLNEQKPQLDDNEKLIDYKNNRAVISITGNNMFYIKQRLLSFGSDCKVIEPEEFKNEYVSMLKTMLEENYND